MGYESQLLYAFLSYNPAMLDIISHPEAQI